VRLEADALLAVLEQLDGFTLCTVASTCKELRTAARDEVLCVQPAARVRARGRASTRRAAAQRTNPNPKPKPKLHPNPNPNPNPNPYVRRPVRVFTPVPDVTPSPPSVPLTLDALAVEPKPNPSPRPPKVLSLVR